MPALAQPARQGVGVGHLGAAVDLDAVGPEQLVEHGVGVLDDEGAGHGAAGGAGHGRSGRGRV